MHVMKGLLQVLNDDKSFRLLIPKIKILTLINGSCCQKRKSINFHQNDARRSVKMMICQHFQVEKKSSIASDKVSTAVTTLAVTSTELMNGSNKDMVWAYGFETESERMRKK